ncbi:MAG: OmpH family outer membrane protein [Bacteroidetes bacterium]|nr:OmpH family outer membrane protein [Bacteroidota bacterium]
MKKVLTVCVAIAASLFIGSSVNAQTKIGFFDDQQILSLMPGITKVDTLLQKFATDSLAPERDQLMEDLKRVDSMLKDSSKLPTSLKITLKKEAAEYYYKLQNWQQYQTQVLQQKQEQLLAPFKKPIYAALQEVISEQKYTVILKPESVLWAEKSDELPLRVLAKLKLPNLPKEIQDQISAFNGGGSSTAPKSNGGGAAKPAPKKPGKG